MSTRGNLLEAGGILSTGHPGSSRQNHWCPPPRGAHRPLVHAVPWRMLSPGAYCPWYVLSPGHTVPASLLQGPCRTLTACSIVGGGTRAWSASPPRAEVCSCAVEASEVSSDLPAVSLQVVGAAAAESQE